MRVNVIDGVLGFIQVLHGFIQDCLKANAAMPLDVNEPLYIVELGAGSGKFSYFMLRAMEEMAEICDFPFKRIVFVMTDFTEKNIDYWLKHPVFQPYFEQGVLDCGIFNAVVDDCIYLRKANRVLSKDSLKNPLVIVANYLFDTLYHDIFQVDGGELKEGLVSTGSKLSEEKDPLEPDIIQRLDNHYLYRKIDPTYYQEEEGDEDHLRRILAWYLNYFGSNSQGASILLPIGALRALRRLSNLSSGKVLIISGDKGSNNPEQFVGLMDPHIAVHGSFSLMVNYHAIGAWVTSKGGFALHNPQEEASLKISTFLLAPQGTFDQVNDDSELMGNKLNAVDQSRARQFPFLRHAFHDFVDSFGPNDFFILQKSLKEDLANPPLRTVVALLKLSQWDPDVFFKFRDTILAHAPNCGQKLRNDLTRGMPIIWNNYYLLDTEKDIAFEIGRYYYGIREYEKALWFYEESTKTIGEHHVTYHNQGLCHFSMGRLEIALTNFKKALDMNADYEKARSWVEKVQSELSMQNRTAVKELTEGDGAQTNVPSFLSLHNPAAN